MGQKQEMCSSPLAPLLLREILHSRRQRNAKVEEKEEEEVEDQACISGSRICIRQSQRLALLCFSLFIYFL